MTAGAPSPAAAVRRNATGVRRETAAAHALRRPFPAPRRHETRAHGVAPARWVYNDRLDTLGGR